MKAAGLDGLASDWISFGNGFDSTNCSRLSSSAFSSATTGSSFWPFEFRFIQRRSETTQSSARTGSPSWKRSPSRSVMVIRLPSFSMTCPADICGRGLNSASIP